MPHEHITKPLGRVGVSAGVIKIVEEINTGSTVVIRVGNERRPQYVCRGRKISALAADSPPHLQEMLEVAGDAAKRIGLTVKPEKFAVLDLDCTGNNMCRETVLRIQNKPIRPMKEGEAYQHLGTPTGYNVDT